MLQTKESDKIPEDELSKVKISNLPNKEFKITIIKMFVQQAQEKKKMYTVRVSQKLRKYEQEDPNRAEEYDNF